MAKQHKIIGRLAVGKGADIKYIGEETDVTHIDKDAAKKYGINAKEFDKLVGSGVLVEGSGLLVEPERSEPKVLSAAKFAEYAKVVNTLDDGDAKLFTNDGKPELAVLKEQGVVMTAAERDEAFDIYNAE